jgi:hypothetical protein
MIRSSHSSTVSCPFDGRSNRFDHSHNRVRSFLRLVPGKLNLRKFPIPDPYDLNAAEPVTHAIMLARKIFFGNRTQAESSAPFDVLLYLDGHDFHSARGCLRLAKSPSFYIRDVVLAFLSGQAAIPLRALQLFHDMSTPVEVLSLKLFPGLQGGMGIRALCAPDMWIDLEVDVYSLENNFILEKSRNLGPVEQVPLLSFNAHMGKFVCTNAPLFFMPQGKKDGESIRLQWIGSIATANAQEVHMLVRLFREESGSVPTPERILADPSAATEMTEWTTKKIQEYLPKNAMTRRNPNSSKFWGWTSSRELSMELQHFLERVRRISLVDKEKTAPKESSITRSISMDDDVAQLITPAFLPTRAGFYRVNLVPDHDTSPRVFFKIDLHQEVSGGYVFSAADSEVSLVDDNSGPAPLVRSKVIYQSGIFSPPIDSALFNPPPYQCFEQEHFMSEFFVIYSPVAPTRFGPVRTSLGDTEDEEMSELDEDSTTKDSELLAGISAQAFMDETVLVPLY